MCSYLISVIVPVFRVENYIVRCVESLVGQTYHNLEIILVDDGSFDGCSQICNEWGKRDSRITVLHKTNGGLSDARNAGMKIAAGEYISFIDSDDYISPDFYEVLLASIQNEGSDVIECGVVKVYENGKADAFFDDLTIHSFSTEEGLSYLIGENIFHQYVWNKLYRTEIVSDFFFPVGKLNEDEFWTYQVFGGAKKVTKVNRTMYFYFQRSTSIMGEKFNVRRLDALEGKAARQKYVNQYYPSLAVQAKIDFYSSCVFSYQSALKYLSGEERREALRKIKEQKRNCELTVDEIKTVRGKFQKYLYFSKISFYACCKLRAVLGVGF